MKTGGNLPVFRSTPSPGTSANLCAGIDPAGCANINTHKNTIAVIFQCSVLISLQMSRHECQMETLL